MPYAYTAAQHTQHAAVQSIELRKFNQLVSVVLGLVEAVVSLKQYSISQSPHSTGYTRSSDTPGGGWIDCMYKAP